MQIRDYFPSGFASAESGVKCIAEILWTFKIDV
jgi:hypothetical protein